MLKNFMLLTILILLVGCESAEQKQLKLNEEKKQAEIKAAELKTKTDAEEKLKAEQAAKIKADAEKAAEEKKVKLAKLLPKFKKTIDKFDNTVRYLHKNYTSYLNTNGTGIVAIIIDQSLFCHSTYVSSDWIFHTGFTVKTGETQNDYSGREQREVVNGIAEAVHLNSSDSQDLVQQIATAEPNKPVMIRLHGKYKHDFNLKATHRQAIKDTWELYQLLKN